MNEQQPDPRPPSAGQLVSTASEQLSRLVRDEVALARVEMTAKAKRVGLGAGLLGGSGVIGLYALGCFVAAAVLGLATVLDPWLSALIIGLALGVIAAGAALLGKKDVTEGTPPVPEQAVSSVKTDIETVKESAHR